MNSAPHLLPEDRPEFERILGEALRTTSERPDPAEVGRRLNTEQLRTMALAAAAAISSCAAAEYQDYVALRDQLRAPVSDAAHDAQSGTGAGGPGGGGPVTLAAAMAGPAEATGAGLVAIVCVLAPVLAAIAAVIFLLVGYALRAVDADEPAAASLVNTGWVFVALTAAGIVLAMAGLLLTALRNGSSSLRASAQEEQTVELGRARDAWRQALLERGVLPFLREALAEPAAPSRRSGDGTHGDGTHGDEPGAHGGASDAYDAGAGAYGGAEAEHRTPHLGYSRPAFSTEGGPEETSARPSFESPGYTSPEYGGPEHEPT
ncbi:hypothetical protein [Streptomyces sp. NPDC047108]|uniref:hypothetical protein n=1 Tax=Streptomyces sp. NPDC047108 TaxID=3155025 RepID=UPI0033F07BF3